MVFAIVQSLPAEEDSTNQSCKSYKGGSFNSVLLGELGLNNLLLRVLLLLSKKTVAFTAHWGNVLLLLWFHGTKLSSDTRWYWIHVLFVMFSQCRSFWHVISSKIMDINPLPLLKWLWPYTDFWHLVKSNLWLQLITANRKVLFGASGQRPKSWNSYTLPIYCSLGPLWIFKKDLKV